MLSGDGQPHKLHAPDLSCDPFRVKTMIEFGAIVVYPDVFPLNILKSSRPVQWNLGMQRGKFIPVQFWFNPRFPGADDKILCLDLIEHDLFNRWDLPERTINTLYSGKALLVKGSRLDLPDLPECIEITPSFPADRASLATLLKMSKVLYTLDPMSSITSEARLCGCPVVYIPNRAGEIYKPEYDISFNGMALGLEDLGRARASLPAFEADYFSEHSRSGEMLRSFISFTQSMKPLQLL